MKLRLIPTIIILILIFIRFLYLNQIPTGITPDELHFVLNAKAVFYNFSDMSDNWSPLSLSTIPSESSSELPFLLISPIIGPLPTNLFTARLPFVITSLLTIFFIYLITKKLSNSNIALFSVIVALINPWSFYTSRTSFDAPIAILFILIFFYSLISLKKSKILFSFLPALIFFYSYIGIKPLFLPIILISSIFSYFFIYQKKYLKWLIILNIFSLLLFVFYLFRLYSNSSLNRLSELYLPSHPQIIALTENLQNQTLSSPFTKIFVNRYTVYFKYFIDKYINNFSPKIMFSSGDPTFLVSLWQHGYFYYLDIFLIFLGSYFLFRNYIKLFLISIAFIILSPIPEAIRIDPNPAYAFHSSIQYPFLYILIAAGLYYFFKITQKFKYVSFITIFIYISLFSNFLFIYFFRYPLYQPDGFNFHQRIISEYIFRENKTKPIIFITSEPDTAFRSYLFYYNLYQPSNFTHIAKQYRSSRDTLKINNITFTKNTSLFIPNSTNTFIIQNEYYSKIPSTLNQIILSHIINHKKLFTILNSDLCVTSTKALTQFTQTSFNLKKLNEQQFCSIYFQKVDSL